MCAKQFVTVGLVCLLSGTPNFAEELPDRLAVAALVEKDSAGIYKLEWQRKLLAIQHAFAAELIPETGVDYTATGSITPTGPALPQH